jgi:hypothetical protein
MNELKGRSPQQVAETCFYGRRSANLDSVWAHLAVRSVSEINQPELDARKLLV